VAEQSFTLRTIISSTDGYNFTSPIEESTLSTIMVTTDEYNNFTSSVGIHTTSPQTTEDPNQVNVEF